MHPRKTVYMINQRILRAAYIQKLARDGAQFPKFGHAPGEVTILTTVWTTRGRVLLGTFFFLPSSLPEWRVVSPAGSSRLKQPQLKTKWGLRLENVEKIKHREGG